MPLMLRSTVQETEAQSGWVTCLRSHSRQQILELSPPRAEFSWVGGGVGTTDTCHQEVE